MSRCSLAIALLLSGLTTTAAAQQPDTAATIPELAEILVVRSSIYTLGTSALPRAIVSGKRIDEWQPSSLAHLLQRESGMSLYDDLGAAAKLTLMSRGFAASAVVGLPQGIAVFLDGIPINEPDAGQVNFDLLPLALLDSVELLSGTAATLGPHALGGAINLVTTGSAGDGGSIELHAGRNAALGGTLRGGGSIASDWHWSAGGEVSREDGWRRLTAARVLFTGDLAGRALALATRFWCGRPAAVWPTG